MVILLVDIHIKPEHIAAFREATIENARSSAQEPGVARFDFVQQNEDPGHFTLIEVYRDESAMAAHKETAHYNTWAAKVADHFAEPRTRQVYTNVYPADAGW
jgi:quinol monooxygenase YgiN